MLTDPVFIRRATNHGPARPNDLAQDLRTGSMLLTESAPDERIHACVSLEAGPVKVTR